MVDFVSCFVRVYDDFNDGVIRERLRYGTEFGNTGVRWACGDCGCAPGGLHHPGCDTEECACCGGQAIACGCYVGDEDLAGDIDLDELDDLDDLDVAPLWEELEAELASIIELQPVDWGSLERFFGGSNAPELSAFMYMRNENDPVHGLIHEFKHVDTRRYLMLNDQLQTFVWSERAGYRVIPRDVALEIAYDGVDSDLFLSTPGSLPRREIYRCRRNSVAAYEPEVS